MNASTIQELMKTSQNMNVLYAEDDESARNSMLLVLEDIFPNIITAIDGEDGLSKFQTESIDLVLTDINMPKMNGIEMITHIREVSKEIPILVLSASNEADNFTKTIKLGIDGYLLKPVDMPQLIEVLSKTIAKVNLKNENEAYKNHLEEKVQERTEQLLYQSFHDQLTEKKNKSALENDLINTPKGTLFLIKIDTLKQYNELYGMQTGSELLKAFSNMLEKYAEDTDYEVYRVHGDSFGLYNGKSQLDEKDFKDSINHLTSAINNFSIFIPEINESLDIDTTIALSVGEEQLIETAEMAIHYAKEQKNSYSVYDKNLHSTANVKNELFWRSEVKAAIQKDNIVPVFHPIVDQGQHPNKYEVLMRLIQETDEDKKIVSPFHFLDIAKKTKQYRRLTEIMVEKSFEVMSTHHADFSLNLSFEDIKDETCLQMLLEHINRYDIGERLILEIVESEYIQDFELVKNFISTFKKMGVRIAIDDFGSGYSNFVHILELKPDYIKIDGSLIQNILTNPQTFVLVKAIISFSQELNIKVIAEFVSSKEIFDTLLELGVDEFQGFYFSEPLLNPFERNTDA